MERTKHKQPHRIPDAINCSVTRDFTQVPNHLLRDPNLSYMAKAVIGLILSLEAEYTDKKKQGWTGEDLVKYMKEDKRAIQATLTELKQSGWLNGTVQRLRPEIRFRRLFRPGG